MASPFSGAEPLSPALLRHAATSVVLAAVVLVIFGGAPAQASRALTTGFASVPFTEGAASRDQWLDRSVASGAGIVLVPVSWPAIAPQAPNGGSRQDDPANPAYDWKATDDAVRAATGRGLQVLLSLYGAPTWAEGAARSPGASPGSWKPDPAKIAAFASAAARRYSGGFADPTSEVRLPRVRHWQLWAEPNLSLYLSPQWERRSGRYVPFAPAHYRRMLNAFYRAVKSVSDANVVVTAGTAPYGDPNPGGQRMMPVRFWREVFCLRGRTLEKASCPDPPRLDALSHHPYGIAGPRRAALNADDAALVDIYKLTRILRVAGRSGRALPRGRKRMWVTEFGWDSRPPDPDGVPETTRARWLAESFYLLWRQGVDTVNWFQIRDQDPGGNYGATYQTGLYFLDGRPKLAARAFAFPFMTERASRERLRAWGKAPVAGSLTIERREGGKWLPVKALRVGGNRVFLTALRLRGRVELRARIGDQTSLTWLQG